VCGHVHFGVHHGGAVINQLQMQHEHACGVSCTTITRAQDTDTHDTRTSECDAPPGQLTIRRMMSVFCVVPMPLGSIQSNHTCWSPDTGLTV
jgi:hypothetical protein